MTRRYSSISVQTTLATGVSNTALVIPVATGTASTLLGGVSLAAGNVDQYSVTIDPNTASAEILWITGVSGDNLTVLRGQDGTSAIAHTAGAVIQHTLTGGDLIYLVAGVAPTADLPNTGLPFPGSTSGTTTVKATAIAGTNTLTLPATNSDILVGRATTDTLTNKTLTSPVLNSPLINIPVSAKTASYTLVAADKNTRVTQNNAGATTITVNTGVFAAGDTCEILNIGAGVCTVTAGTATVATAGTLALVQNAGGTLYFTSTGVATFIPSGVTATTGFVGASAYASAAQSVTQNVATVVALNTNNYDTNAFHNTVTNNSRFTIPSGKDGKYRVTVTGRIITGAQVGFALYKNGSGVTQGLVSSRIAFQVNTSGYSAYPTGTYDISLVAGDYIEIFCNCDAATGSNLEFVTVSIQFLGA